MTIALPVTTKSIQHYHFHYGEDEESRSLRSLGQLGPHPLITPQMIATLGMGSRRLNGGKHNRSINDYLAYRNNRRNKFNGWTRTRSLNSHFLQSKLGHRKMQKMSYN